MKKTIFFALSLLILSCSGETDTGDSSSGAVAVTSAEVQTRNLSETFSVSSQVVAYRRSYVASRISGLIEDVQYEEGQPINKGDILAQVDVRQQQIELRWANAALEEAHDVYERNQTLIESNAISRAEYLSSRRVLEQAQSDVDHLELQIEFGIVRAPIKGVVTARLVDPGNNVSINERMFTVTDMDLLVVRPGVSEMNITGLEEGQSVEIKLDVYPEKIFNGSIRRVFPSSDAQTGLFTVEVEIKQEEGQQVIRPGFLARTQFSVDPREDIPTVPSEALIEREGETYLFVLNEEKDSVSLVPVSTGVSRDGYVEIRNGVQPGDVVAASNVESLDDGSEVRVVGTFRRYGFSN